jgi:hypothetical protein
MTLPTLTQTRLAHGLWQGHLAAETALPVEAWHLDRCLEGVTVTAWPGGGFQVQVPLPADLISEGVQTVLLRAGDAVLAQITLVAGVPLEEDLRAEIGLLRAELDVLKRAFRRHCAETAG